MKTEDAWKELLESLREVRAIENIGSVLSWDQQTYMPPAAGAARGEQLALLSRLAHQRSTAPRVGELLDALEGVDDPIQAAAVRNTRRQYDRYVRVDESLVAEAARARADGFEQWMAARNEGDFGRFAPALERLLDVTRETAQAIDPHRPIYDVLLEDFDPGITCEDLRPTFDRLVAGLVPLIEATRECPQPTVPAVTLPIEQQRRLHERVTAALGFDTRGGRLDLSQHPFTIDLGPGDVRITTHLYEDDLLAGLGGTIHETGHALYEQGLPADLWGTTLAKAASFGLHESQSRLWENFIGRSRPFFGWFAGLLAEEGITGLDADTLYRAANRVAPGPIRIFADEVTYNLHIVIRFEIELALFDGRLAVADLPEAWNERYRQVLGIVPPSLNQGVLQDVHWASGAFAYFPSYTLGNLYAAQLGATLDRTMEGLWDDVGNGRFDRVLAWLREHVHTPGHRKEAPEILRDAVGERDGVDDLLDHAWRRFGALYGVERPR